MSNVIKLDDFRKYLFAYMAFCFECEHRWTGGANKHKSLFQLSCPHCHKENSFVSIIPAEIIPHFTDPA